MANSNAFQDDERSINGLQFDEQIPSPETREWNQIDKLGDTSNLGEQSMNIAKQAAENCVIKSGAAGCIAKGECLVKAGCTVKWPQCPDAEVEKYIRHVGDKWKVFSEAGKVLGTHDSKESAAQQLAAIEANKPKKQATAKELKALRAAVDKYVFVKKIVLKSKDGVQAELMEETSLGDIYRIAWGEGKNERTHFVVGGDIALHLPFYAQVSKAAITWITKADDKPAIEKRYTLGVVYPHDEVDFHGDTMTGDEIEKAAWLFMSKEGGSGRIGLMHRPGTNGAGRVVESYIYRGPDWKIKSAGGSDKGDQLIKSGDWMMGVVWEPEPWEAIKMGKITGYSLQGVARKEGFE